MSKLLFVALLLPPIIFILVYFLTVDIRLQKKDPAAARRKRAYKNFQKNLLLVNDVRKLESSVKAYFGDRFNLVEDAHVLSEFSSALGEHEKAVVELYELFDSQRFSESGKTAELTEMKNRAQKIIENVNRSLKNV